MKNNYEIYKQKSFLKKFIPYLPYILLFFFSFSFLYHNDLSFNQDLGRHLKLGEIIWQTHNVPKTNLFSYTNPDFAFINHHWLFEVIVYVSSITIGLQTLLVIKTILLLIITSLVLLLCTRTKSSLLFPIAYIFFHLLRGRTDLRPEIISFLFTVLTISILEEFERRNSKLIYILPLISLLWVNTHIYFPVGIFLQLIFLSHMLFARYIQKKKDELSIKKITTLSIITGTSIVISLINPSFLKGALYPFTVFSNYGVSITENQSAVTLQRIHFVNPDFFFFYLAAGLTLCSIYISFWRTKFSVKNVLLSILGLALAIQSIRGFPYLALISLPYVLFNFNYKNNNIWTKNINIAVGILLLLEAFFYLNGSYYGLTYKPNLPILCFEQDGKPALDYVLNKKLPGPIFNNFDIGSYLIYRLYPTHKVFIDGRPEAYPASFFTNTYLPVQENYAQFKHEEKKVGFNTIIFSITDQNPRTLRFFNNLLRDPNWKVVFLDQFMIVFVKKEVQQERKLHSINLATLDSKNYHYTNSVPYTNLSTFLFNTHQIEQALIFNQKALELNPDNPAANKIMSYILYLKKASYTLVDKHTAKAQNRVFW